MKDILSAVPRTLSHGKNTITNLCEITNVFNNYFASITDTAMWNIKYSYKYFSENLKHQQSNYIFFQPTIILPSTLSKLVVHSVFQIKSQFFRKRMFLNILQIYLTSLLRLALFHLYLKLPRYSCFQ